MYNKIFKKKAKHSVYGMGHIFPLDLSPLPMEGPQPKFVHGAFMV